MRPRQTTCKYGHPLAVIGKRQGFVKSKGTAVQYDRRECRICRAMNNVPDRSFRVDIRSPNQLALGFGKRTS